MFWCVPARASTFLARQSADSSRFRVPRPCAGPCVHELFEEVASRTPHAVAVVDVHRTLTFRELRAAGLR